MSSVSSGLKSAALYTTLKPYTVPFTSQLPSQDPEPVDIAAVPIFLDVAVVNVAIFIHWEEEFRYCNTASIYIILVPSSDSYELGSFKPILQPRLPLEYTFNIDNLYIEVKHIKNEIRDELISIKVNNKLTDIPQGDYRREILKRCQEYN